LLQLQRWFFNRMFFSFHVSQLENFTMAKKTTGCPVSLTTFDLSNVEQFAESIGYNVETGEIRNNRGTQVSTDKIIELIKASVIEGTKELDPDGLYRPTVATIRIGSRTGDCADGGNTFRGIHHCITEGIVDSIEALVLVHPDFDFRGYNQIDANRKPSQVINMSFGDGWGEFRQQVFGLSCLRSKGLNVVGGGVKGRTWKGSVLHSSDDIANLFKETSPKFDYWLACLVEGYHQIHGSTSNQSLLQIVETLNTLTSKFTSDADGALLLHAVLDVMLNDVAKQPDDESELWDYLVDKLPEVLDSLSVYIAKGKTFSDKLNLVWNPAKNMPKHDRQNKFKWLTSLVKVAIHKLDLSQLKIDVTSQGIEKHFSK